MANPSLAKDVILLNAARMLGVLWGKFVLNEPNKFICNLDDNHLNLRLIHQKWGWSQSDFVPPVLPEMVICTWAGYIYLTYDDEFNAFVLYTDNSNLQKKFWVSKVLLPRYVSTGGTAEIVFPVGMMNAEHAAFRYMVEDMLLFLNAVVENA